MKKQYKRERIEAIKQWQKAFKNEILTEEKLKTVPHAIQNHFRLSGFVGKPIAMNADVIWQESFIKLKPNQTWKPLQTLQFNSVNPIMRSAFMKVNKMFFAGKDLYKNGQGTMQGKILNLISVINAKGEKVSQSALITSFCEMMLLSGYAFQNYIQWQEIDNYSVKATLKDHQHTVYGTFYFDQEGKFSYFETDDRYFEISNGNFEKKIFRAKVNTYKRVKNALQIKDISCLWVLDGTEYEYFKGEIQQINYNVVE